jgi:hypothetical protein
MKEKIKMTSVISHVSAHVSGSESPRNIWGPLVWNSFHLLCSISDRRDIVYRWRKLLELTTIVMPCAACRNHMTIYLRSHRIFGTKLMKYSPTSGIDVKTRITNGLFEFHNHVNTSNGKPVLSFEEAQLKLNIVGKSRKEIGNMIRANLTQLDPLWSTYRPREYSIWQSEFLTLLRICESGPY